MNSTHELAVESLKTRLDKYLADHVAVSRSRIQRDIESGFVMVNGENVRSSKHVVRLGDSVKYEYIDEIARPATTPSPLKTLYNNHGLLIIDKPAGLAVHPGAGLKGDSLADALLYYFKDIYLVGEEGRSGIVHRLDKDTSGVMLIALTQSMYEHLKDAFAERKIKKEYIALVKGTVQQSHGTINVPVGKSSQDFRKYVTENMITAKDALTEYWVLERLDGWTLVRVRLHTGRTHQIRVHFSSIGHPLAGDPLYGGKSAQLAGLSRQFLHARQIEVQLPDETWVEADSTIADDLRVTLRNLHSKKVDTI